MELEIGKNSFVIKNFEDISNQNESDFEYSQIEIEKLESEDEDEDELIQMIRDAGYTIRKNKMIILESKI